MNMRQAVFGMMVLIATLGCTDRKSKSEGEVDSTNPTGERTILTGKLPIIVDQASLPIIEQQIEVFKTSYVNADVQVVALPEREAINALLEGKANIAVLGRMLSEEESVGFNERGIKPRIFPVHHDGVVFFNNISAADTAMDVSEVTALLRGESQDRVLIFDDINSSTFRMVKDFADVERVSGQSVKEADNLEEIFQQVQSDSRAIGVVSYAQYLEFRRLFGDENKIRILSLQTLKNGVSEGYFKPSQSTFATGDYAIKTPFYVLNYQPDMGAGIGFSAFLTGDRGQRIALKYGLLPVTMPGREIIIREDNIN